ncbi:hypothetical protein O181_010508 [Austropuccinia psidii MF-1]|uniref:Uncharacterized protein n=1 Tax=Austropuccinia psidii MF-1 TaxID=1389203 RepID=A0A9Q3BT53_9BASI|nr:hypothetical protein [Austropuccinia psidii MF-1]
MECSNLMHWILLLHNSLARSSKLTELTYYSPSAPPPSVLCGSGILSWLASSRHFDPGQTYDGYKAVKVLDPAFTECFAKGKDLFQNFNSKSSKCHLCFVGKKPCHCPGSEASNVRRYLWSKKDGPVSVGSTPDATSGYSECSGMWQHGPMLEDPFQLVVGQSTPAQES